MKFAIGFDKRDLPRLHGYWDKIVESEQWTEGYFTRLFEEKWSESNQLGSVAFSSWAGGASAIMEYYGLRGETVLVPSNTFMATVLATKKAGATVKFVDCNKYDLCLSFEDLQEKIRLHRPKAVWLVHIGGHIAFDVRKIAALCRDHNIMLFEDCAHAHGASWNGERPGTWGDAGVYSFYATKTISTGEGGMLVSKHPDLLDFARSYRNYGKPTFAVEGANYRMNEFTAAIGVVQTERLNDIVQWKNERARVLDERFSNRVSLPDGMVSGYYKYIVFEPIEHSTGKVYDTPCHKIMADDAQLPNTEWVAKHHWCVPLYYETGLTVEPTR